MNIRRTGNSLWFPRQHKPTMDKMDTLYERVSPELMQWDATRPKVEDIDEHINPNTDNMLPFLPKEEREKREKQKLEFDEE